MQRTHLRLALLAASTACGDADPTNGFGGPSGDTRTSEAVATGSETAASDTYEPTTGADDPATTAALTTGAPAACQPGETRPGAAACDPDCTCSPAGAWSCPPGCDETTTTDAATTTTTTTTTGEPGATTGEALQLPACDLAQSDAYTLHKLAVEGDTLSVTTSYAGGCTKHHFELCFVMEKDDVLLLHVTHDDDGDTCDGYINDTVLFDLTPLRSLPSPVEFTLLEWSDVLEYVY